MTNIVASIVVTIVTNTTEVFPTYNFPSSPPQTYDSNGVPQPFMNAVAYFETRQVPNPTNKWVYTECKEITVLRFDWNGLREITSEKLVWRTVQHYKLDKAWNPDGGAQPAMPIEVTGFNTNFPTSVLRLESK